MGTFNSKTTTKTNSTESGTKTPINPPWVTDAVQGMAGRVNDFMGLDPQSLVAGPSALQTQAFDAAGNLGGWQAGNQSAMDMAQGAGSAGPSLFNGVKLGAADQVGDVNSESHSLLDGFSNYMDPATKQLVDASMANYDQESGRRGAAMMADGARNEAFGGSRFGIREGEFNSNEVRNRALTDAQLRTNAFTQALGASNLDAGRRQGSSEFNAGLDQQRLMANAGANNQFALTQGGFDAQQGMFNATAEEQARQRALQAAGLMGNLSSDYGQQDRADLGMTSDLGTIQQQIAQAQAMAPAMQLQLGTQAYGSLPFNLFNGMQVDGTSSGTSVAKTNPSLFGMLLQGAQQAASAAAAGSDRRLKRDIEHIGSHGKLNLYNFNYNWDAAERAKRTGVMADEVARYAPDALGPVIDGYATVNYEKLGLAHLVEDV